MHKTVLTLIDKLAKERRLTVEEYETLITHRNEKAARKLAELAVRARKAVYGNTVFVRGLIEVSNICQNNCLYCGIRSGNANCVRYRLSRADILDCCKEGYALGFRTFVLQGGEDPAFTDEFLCDVIRTIKETYPDCAVTLSLGERSFESYKALKEAGADRYLLRHETADTRHYALLHPAEMTLATRLQCLNDLKSLGYQVGCGFMVGSPHQTAMHLAQDLKFVEEFTPAMCGIGPFIPQKDTPFHDKEAGTVELTCYLLSILRLMHPHLLLPATTALGSIDPNGREMGILAGANVVMPNLSPASVRKKYALYDNKLTDGEESAQCKAALEQRMQTIGYQVVTDRGDVRY